MPSTHSISYPRLAPRTAITAAVFLTAALAGYITGLHTTVASFSRLGIALSSPQLHAAVLPTPALNPAPAFREKRYSSIFYFKTHKTGSTTIANTLYEYAKRHKLSTLTAPGHMLVSTPNPRPAVRVHAVVGHHVVFDWPLILSYLRPDALQHVPAANGSAPVARPALVLTSFRLPMQRQISWFRQQNKQWDTLQCNISDGRDALFRAGNASGLLSAFDRWVADGRRSAPQWRQLQERRSRLYLRNDATRILEQFDFVFAKERMRDSFECACAQLGIRLCDAARPLRNLNVRREDGCVAEVLRHFRAAQLAEDSELDTFLYERVAQRLSDCVRQVPEECKCPVETT